MWTEILFYIFSTLMIISALCVVFSRNVVNSALYMVVTLISMACLFVLLESYLLAILQILVYAGAVMVLFLFIIMLIDVEGNKKSKIDLMSLVSSLAVALFVSLGIGMLLGNSHFEVLTNLKLFPVQELPVYTGSMLSFATSAKSFGLILFSKYLLPFELAGILLLMAIVGVMVLSKVSAKTQMGSNKNQLTNGK